MKVFSSSRWNLRTISGAAKAHFAGTYLTFDLCLVPKSEQRNYRTDFISYVADLLLSDEVTRSDKLSEFIMWKKVRVLTCRCTISSQYLMWLLFQLSFVF